MTRWLEVGRLRESPEAQATPRRVTRAYRGRIRRGREGEPRHSGLLACSLAGLGLLLASLASAGPPYVSDDPEPTDTGHYEIYLFGSAQGGAQGIERNYGVDFNYGAAENLQLTATLPFSRLGTTDDAHPAYGLGNVELAAKYRFLRQQATGWDVAFFPRLFLPSPSARFGERHASLLLPLWVEKDWDSGWSTFGGGGCEWNRGGDSKDFCLAGWALARQLLPTLQLGVELVHQTADTRGGRASTSAGVGIKYDLDDHLHVLAYVGPGLQNIAPNARYSWYSSVLITF